ITSTYSWTIGTITGGISGASAGSGSSIDQILTNPNNATSGSVEYLVTATSTTGTCVGPAKSIVITVNPTPLVTTANSKTICSEGQTDIDLESTVTGATFGWTRTINGGITGSGNGSGSSI